MAMKSKLFTDGSKFGDLTIIRLYKDGIYECECICGNIVYKAKSSLRKSIKNNYYLACDKCKFYNKFDKLTDEKRDLCRRKYEWAINLANINVRTSYLRRRFRDELNSYIGLKLVLLCSSYNGDCNNDDKFQAYAYLGILNAPKSFTKSMRRHNNIEIFDDVQTKNNYNEVDIKDEFEFVNNRIKSLIDEEEYEILIDTICMDYTVEQLCKKYKRSNRTITSNFIKSMELIRENYENL